jgi:hypothetical protein
MNGRSGPTQDLPQTRSGPTLDLPQPEGLGPWRRSGPTQDLPF